MSRQIIQELSPREEAILRLAAEGLTDTAIAHKLGISEGTVGTYWGRVRTKLGPYPRTALIALRVRAELEGKLEDLLQERKALLDKMRETVDDDEMFHEIVNAADEGVVLVGCDGVIRHANPVGHEIFGYAHGELRGKSLVELIPERLRGGHLEKFGAYCCSDRSATGHPHLQAMGLHSDGREISLSISISAVHRGKETLLTGFFTPAVSV